MIVNNEEDLINKAKDLQEHIASLKTSLTKEQSLFNGLLARATKEDKENLSKHIKELTPTLDDKTIIELNKLMEVWELK